MKKYNLLIVILTLINFSSWGQTTNPGASCVSANCNLIDLVSNGNFDNALLAPATTGIATTGVTCTANSYTVATNSQDLCPVSGFWPDLFDFNDQGVSSMLVIDTPPNNTIVWEQNVVITAGQDYVFEMALLPCVSTFTPGFFPIISVQLNDNAGTIIPILTVNTYPEGSLNWNNNCASFTASTSGTFALEIIQTSLGGPIASAHGDYAIDNIHFSHTSEVIATQPVLNLCSSDLPINIGIRNTITNNVNYTYGFFTPFDGFPSSLPIGGDFTILPGSPAISTFPVGLGSPHEVIQFDPSVGPGTYTIEYTYTSPTTGCSDSEQMQIIVDGFSPSITPITVDICASTSPVGIFPLMPLGVTCTFSGPGSAYISGGFFDPVAAGIGVHNFNLTCVTSGGCSTTTSSAVTVVQNPINVVATTPSLTICESDEPFLLGAEHLPTGNIYWTNDFFTPIDGYSPSIPVPGGAYTVLPPVNLNTFGPFQTIEFDPSIGPGVYPVQYTYTDPVTGCSGFADMTIEVIPETWQQTTSNANASNNFGDEGFDVFTDEEYVYATGSFIRETTFDDGIGNSITINSNQFDLPCFYAVCHNTCGELQWVIYDNGLAGANSNSEGFGVNREGDQIFVGLNYRNGTNLTTVYPNGSSVNSLVNGNLGTVTTIGHLAVISVDGPNSPFFGQVLGMGDILEDHIGTALDVQKNGPDSTIVYVSGKSDTNDNGLSNAFASRLDYLITGESFSNKWTTASLQETPTHIANDIIWDARLNGVFITGTYQQKIAFNASNISALGFTDAYIAWLDPSDGDIVFNNLHTLGSVDGAKGTCLTSDDNNHIYFGGTVRGDISTAFSSFLGGTPGFTSSSLQNSSYIFSWQINSASLDIAEISNPITYASITGMDANEDELSFVGTYRRGTLSISSGTTDARVNVFNRNYIFIGNTEISASGWNAHKIVNSTQNLTPTVPGSVFDHISSRISVGGGFTYTTGSYLGDLDYFNGSPVNGPLVASGASTEVLNAFILRQDISTNAFRMPVSEADHNESIESVKTSLQINAFPNPTNGMTTILIEGYDFETPALLEIYNLQGQKIYDQTLNQKKYEIDLSQFDNGTYLIKINLNDRIETIRIVKQ